MKGRRLYIITATMMLSIFVASLESSVITTAMPTIVAEMGGLQIYAWVFAIYNLTSTTLIPVFGKLSDIYGRRGIYVAAMAVFITGSILCGAANSMEQLIVFRAIQGIGAGGLLPLAFTVIGDIFSFEQRARMQGLFSSIWATSAIVGPVVGGFLVDNVTWRWVFLINIPFGLLAMGLMWYFWRDVSPRQAGQVDYAGTLLLIVGVIALMLGLYQLSNGTGGWSNPYLWLLLATSLGLLGLLVWVERRVPNPILPLGLFRDRLFSVAMTHGFLAGFAVWGSWVFVPLFTQTVLGTSAVAAGATLMPMDLTWVAASVVGTRLLLRYGYRSVALSGMAATVAGMAGMALVGPTTAYWQVMLYSGLMGIGMGFSIPSFTIAVQSTVQRQAMGTATSNLQFSRNIGGTIGTSIMGVLMAIHLARGLMAGGLSPESVSLGQLLDPLAGPEVLDTLNLLREALSAGVRDIFVWATVAAALAWAVTALAPRDRLGQNRPSAAPEVAVSPGGE